MKKNKDPLDNQNAYFQEIKPLLENISKGIAEQFGPNCEVAVHNLTHGYSKTIEIIANGHVTGRKVGDDASEIALEMLKSKTSEKDQISYKMMTKDGRIVKSTTIYLKDKNEEIFGILAINYDVTDLTITNNVISGFINTQVQDDLKVEAITNNVNELLDTLIEESLNYIGKPVSTMNKSDKIRAIQFLDKKGAFLITRSGSRISKVYDISKYTLYNYLNNGEAT